MTVSLEYMREKLLEWNPHWDPTTVEEWTVQQVHAIYRQQQQKIVKQIRVQLGLPN